MIIKLEPDLRGKCSSVELIYDMPEARPFRLTLTTSHDCVADDLYHLAKAVSLVLVPLELAQNGRRS